MLGLRCIMQLKGALKVLLSYFFCMEVCIVKWLYRKNGLNFRDFDECYLNGFNVQLSANPLVLNDDCQTALEVARAKGNSNVVRAMEVAFKL